MMSYNTKRQIPELLASLGNIGGSSHNLPLSHSICCKLCLGIFNHPKLLPCLHSFCLGCLQAYIHKSSDNIQERKLLCPICQESNTLPGTGLKGLLDNKVIEHSIASNVPTLSLRKKQEPLFPGLYSDSEDSYEVLVKKANPKTNNEDDVYDEYSDTENIQWQNFIQRQKSADFETTDCDIKKPINISEALKGLSDEERLEKLTNSLKNTFSFSQALQEHEFILDNEVRALRTPSSSSEYSFTQRDFLQDQLSCLQTEAMHIIYRLDGISTSGDTWERSRVRIEQQIHSQIEQLITTIRQAERKLLNQIDSYGEHHASINPVSEGRQQLQSLLKNILGVIDFIRLVLNYGCGRGIEQYEKLVANRCEQILSKTVAVEKTEVSFAPGQILEEELDKLLGFLTFTTTHDEIWKCRDNETKDESIATDSTVGDLKHENDVHQERILPPSFSREFLQNENFLIENGQSFTPDSLTDDQEQQRLTVDQLIHKFSTEFGMRYNEILPDDNSSTPMTSSMTSENPMHSPIPEESNGNGIESEIQSIKTRHRPRSSKRRHSVSDVQQDLAQSRIDLSDNRYRGLTRDRKSSVPYCDIMTKTLNERPLSNDLEQTKRILALCKRQLLEAKSMGIYKNRAGTSPQSSVTSPESKMTRSLSVSHENKPSVSSSEHKLPRSRSISHDRTPLSSPEHTRMARSMSRDYVQSIRKRLGMEKPRMDSAGSEYDP
ncbi:uncharacterized protein LOC143063108 [Mytilus galloprovincialis]|uniref:uncharacterized protein LOC143063108 n=1 Tax=Mytilus galloprovincialis TaxID=29158 RepID=UPI003F7CB022